jgi:hypothetical protein
MDLIAQSASEALIAMGLGKGKYVTLDGNTRSEYRAQAENEASGYFGMDGLVVVLDADFFPMQDRPGPNGEKDPMTRIAEELGQHLNNGTLRCHLVLKGSRPNIEALMAKWPDGARHRFQAKVSTHEVTNRKSHEYDLDNGHLKNEYLLEYFRYYCQEAGIQFEDGVLRSHESTLTKFLNEQKRLPDFSNQLTIKSIVESAMFLWTAERAPRVAQGEPGHDLALLGGGEMVPAGSPGAEMTVVGKKDFQLLLGDVAAVYGKGWKDVVKSGFRGLTARLGQPIQKGHAFLLDGKVQAMREKELRGIGILSQDIAYIRLGTGELNTPNVRKEVLKHDWAVQMLTDYGYGNVGTMSGVEIEDAFIALGKRFKEQLEMVHRFPIDEKEVEEDRHKDNIKAQRKIARAQNTSAVLQFLRPGNGGGNAKK